MKGVGSYREAQGSHLQVSGRDARARGSHPEVPASHREALARDVRVPRRRVKLHATRAPHWRLGMQADEIFTCDNLVAEETANLQKGMNFGIGRTSSVLLMSVRKGAPYAEERNKLEILPKVQRTPSAEGIPLGGGPLRGKVEILNKFKCSKNKGSERLDH